MHTPVGPRVEHTGSLERLCGQRLQQRLLQCEVLSDRPCAGADLALVILDIPLLDQVIELADGGDIRHGDEMVAAEPADLAFNPDLLMRAFLTWPAIEGVQPEVGSKGQPAFVSTRAWFNPRTFFTAEVRLS
ncbi:hypothetical protein SMD20_26160 [Nonomuraea sp. LP-02]|uniref:hypothetical protein n=1 Tax=Nonomuraea sp. LP-02 TaxID=3097960 RepID=UPI002E2EA37B|nr:hypothetical protein [Nonomuraea sp. LP-02]MED7927771.1 hypothetical protein [Nonomuraea sp. LP-02]